MTSIFPFSKSSATHLYRWFCNIEFAKLFLEKINGSYANLPDYVVGGDNKEFFSSIFIYLGKFRSIISDGLMNKIYNELNLLN